MNLPAVPVLALVAASGTGKTTLLCGLLPHLRRAGLHVGVIKQACDAFDVDTPDKDSFELRRAGLVRTLVTGLGQSALVHEHAHLCPPTLAEALDALPTAGLDLVLVEGYATADLPKLELLRRDVPVRPRYPHDPTVIAVAADGTPDPLPVVPCYALADHVGLAGFVLEFLRRTAPPPSPEPCHER